MSYQARPAGSAPSGGAGMGGLATRNPVMEYICADCAATNEIRPREPIRCRDHSFGRFSCVKRLGFAPTGAATAAAVGLHGGRAECHLAAAPPLVRLASHPLNSPASAPYLATSNQDSTGALPPPSTTLVLGGSLPLDCPT
ncbi:uncharacterized protein PAN0_015c5070 [Moesziomyces antarcticus]|uniref:Uncharacterized protein n=1 Tax=Pseudozyma antarctica TaxID=84753 RepID=A0A081CJK0_PSEA2|nr:uncharacterized protein PAN0_015c5070 [Moesziomyces antarcticus]GAK66846.1 hypothetical protein PAN0_015c5070 [Moesziomyces antarcticus]